MPLSWDLARVWPCDDEAMPDFNGDLRNATDRATLIGDAARRAIRYGARTPQLPVSPADAALDELGRFAAALPADGAAPGDVLALLDDIGSPATVRSTGGRYFGFVTGGSDPVATAASILATAWDQNSALPVMSPVAARLDAIVSHWIPGLLGLAPTVTSSFCAGASIANLTCLVAARDALLRRAGWDVAADGLVGAPPIHVVTSAEIHVSVPKALRVIGIGDSAISYVPTDNCGRLELDSFPSLDRHTLVIAQAGNVNTGHSDPFVEIIAATREADGWVHVDGAFGLWAAASPDHRHLVTGVEAADSWATDAHKWLNVPYDSGIAICADGDDLSFSMAAGAAYLPAEEGRAPMHLGLQMSQRARAIETWAVLATRGSSGIAELIASSCRLAYRFATLLADGGAEILAPVVLNQALVAFGDDDTTDAVIAATQRDGTCWAGGTTWQGIRAMRISVSDTATTDADIETSAKAILSCWATCR